MNASDGLGTHPTLMEHEHMRSPSRDDQATLQQTQIFPPCQTACPAGTDVPAYVAAIWEGDLDSAFQIITEHNPFASVCGRVCAMPCESSCRRGESDGAVSIRGLKRHVMENAVPKGHRLAGPVTRPETVGIVGGGPAGLTAARDLAEAGYEVHVYERRSRLGGMMAAGIPRFRLPPHLLDEDIDRILGTFPGIVPHLDCTLGADLTLEALLDQHGAVLLTLGLWQDRRLNVRGEEERPAGLYGIDFLVKANEGQPPDLHGKKVVVIGGGNVAIDMARTALRAGGQKVDLYCLESSEEMPAWDHELQEALEEGVTVHNGWGPRAILQEQGRVTGIDLVRCASVFDEEGRFCPTFDETTTAISAADIILLAIGLTLNGKVFADFAIADPESTRTQHPRIFSSGDFAFGPSSVIRAVERGHRSAYYIRALLEGVENPAPYRPRYSSRRPPLALDSDWETLPRERPTFLGLGDEPSLYAPCDVGFDLASAKRQAARCLRCDVETGTAGVSRESRETLHAMSQTEPGDTEALRRLLQRRLWPRDNPFPAGRAPSFDDVVFLAAALTRLVIDPYREECVTKTTLAGRLELSQPFLVTGFDDVPEAVKESLRRALAERGCGYIGRSSLGEEVPWLQLLSSGGQPDSDARGVIYVGGSEIRPSDYRKAKSDQLLGATATASTLADVLPDALENGLDLLVLDGSGRIDSDWPELTGDPDLTVLRDAIRILRALDREEHIDLVYFGGLRTGTDVAKIL
ncbi:MAG: FAD-dependent oxidoreductase, partial [Actinobacteria bacterium]|nr:FAD-dependent oxidoreductase [Actinomycetota bacterium]